ncbi:MAG: type II toxin-antitoxin system RelE/ParE family toxin [Chlorobi bacterium]|nr:type II toxin-antitoxin system RelE/ParE family toxin [Chlorobiota bacterium]
MEIRVFWTQTFLDNLEDIFEYYKLSVSLKIAKKLVKEIVEKTLLIQNSPKIGRTEELLTDRKFEHRFQVISVAGSNKQFVSEDRIFPILFTPHESIFNNNIVNKCYINVICTTLYKTSTT